MEDLLLADRGGCTDADGDCGQGGHSSDYPVTTFSDFCVLDQVSLREPATLAVCRPHHRLATSGWGFQRRFLYRHQSHRAAGLLLDDVANNALPSYAFIEAAYGTATSIPVPDNPSSTDSNRSPRSSTL